jgi:ATP-dependent helicase/nuclease subunit A
MASGRLPFDADVPAPDPALARDEAARRASVDPAINVALEASAGTGKTRVLVERYVNLLVAGVDPRNILAMTFTRKAAAEMRERIVSRLRELASEGSLGVERWRDLRDHLGEIAIDTIDAFCLSLLHEFPLDADVDPGFTLADETDVPRLVDEALDRTLRAGRIVAAEREDVSLVFAHLGEARLRRGLARLIDRRLVAERVLARTLTRGRSRLTLADVERAAIQRLARAFAAVPGGVDAFLATGPGKDPRFELLGRDVGELQAVAAGGVDASWASGWLPALAARLRDHLFTVQGEPRKRLSHKTTQFASREAYRAHTQIVVELAPLVGDALAAYRRDLNGILARGVWWLFSRAADEFRRTLDEHALLDFSEVLIRALALLRQMDEFSRSRYRLEARYQHVLVDELQDTSRAQWELVELLVHSWGEGLGLSGEGRLPPSIFVVGDRKQSIYGFRDAEVAVLEEAARFIGSLRPGSGVRRAISRSHRARPPLLAFANDVFSAIDKAPAREDAFRYDEQDAFPLPEGMPESEEALGVIALRDVAACARAVAIEIGRLLDQGAVVRDRELGTPRPIQPGDIAILFRSRDSHRQFERELERAQVPFYVYKGLGFFDAEEIKDVLALVHYLADPQSNRRAAALLRSRFIRLSDEGLLQLAPDLAGALATDAPPAAAAVLSPEDRLALTRACDTTAAWRAGTDRVPPAELLDRALAETAYALELGGQGATQARENLKKIRALVRRLQNRGYATMARVAGQLGELAGGDESNAVVDAVDAVSLMTVHAAKGLEFPVVFLVNLSRGTGGAAESIRLRPDLVASRLSETSESDAVAVGEFESDLDRDAPLRDREETKRLLYVAVTRARDRLYLASTLASGQRLRPMRGSLADVLPASLVSVIEAAGASADGARVTWRGRTTEHVLRVCGEAAVRRTVEAPPWPETRVDDFVPFDPGAAPRAVTTFAAEGTGRSEGGGLPTKPDERPALAGALVHRALQAGLPFELARDQSTLRRELGLLVRPDERAGPRSLDGTLDAATLAFTSLAGRDDIRALLAAGRHLHEVPVSLRVGEAVLRGAIDLLIVAPDGRVAVVEFKTGARAEAHRRQLALYVEAVRGLFPGAIVEGCLVYAGD